MIQKTALILAEGKTIPLATARNSHQWKNNFIQRKPPIGQILSPGIITTDQTLEGYFTFRLTLETVPHLFRLITGNHLDTIHVPETRSLYKETRTIGNTPVFDLQVEENGKSYIMEEIEVTAFELTACNPSPLYLKLYIEGRENIRMIPYTPIEVSENQRFFYLMEPGIRILNLEGTLKESPSITLKTSDEMATGQLTITAKSADEYEANRCGLFEVTIEAINLIKTLKELDKEKRYKYTGTDPLFHIYRN